MRRTFTKSNQIMGVTGKGQHVLAVKSRIGRRSDGRALEPQSMGEAGIEERVAEVRRDGSQVGSQPAEQASQPS